MRAYFVASIICISSLTAGCAAPSLSGPGMPPDRFSAGAFVAAASNWMSFRPATKSTASYTYDGLTNGPNNMIWFEDIQGNGIVRISPKGVAKEFAGPGVMSDAAPGMARGSDGRFYFGTMDTTTPSCGSGCGAVGAMTTAGVATMYDIGTSETNTDVPTGGFARGSDGNVWFTEYHHIGMITPAGVVTQYPYPGNYQPEPGDIAAGGDGNLWFSLGGAGINPAWVGKIVPSTGTMTFFNLSSLVGCGFDNAITAANDGNVWVDCGTTIVRVTPSGTATAFSPPSNAAPGEVSGDMTAGVGQTIWYGGAEDSGKVVEYNISTNKFTPRTPPASTIEQPRDIIYGSNGNVWFTAIYPGSPSRMEIAEFLSKGT